MSGGFLTSANGPCLPRAPAIESGDLHAVLVGDDPEPSPPRRLGTDIIWGSGVILG
jgi:hypothetical protein